MNFYNKEADVAQLRIDFRRKHGANSSHLMADTQKPEAKDCVVIKGKVTTRYDGLTREQWRFITLALSGKTLLQAAEGRLKGCTPRKALWRLGKFLRNHRVRSALTRACRADSRPEVLSQVMQILADQTIIEGVASDFDSALKWQKTANNHNNATDAEEGRGSHSEPSKDKPALLPAVASDGASVCVANTLGESSFSTSRPRRSVVVTKAKDTPQAELPPPDGGTNSPIEKS